MLIAQITDLHIGFDRGNAHELNDGVVPVELEDKARLAQANCPEFAISITE